MCGMLMHIIIPYNVCSEMFHGSRWLEDEHFFLPMVSLTAGNVFVRDFVKFSLGDSVTYGRVHNFFFKVNYVAYFAVNQYKTLGGPY